MWDVDLPLFTQILYLHEVVIKCNLIFCIYHALHKIKIKLLEDPPPKLLKVISTIIILYNVLL